MILSMTGYGKATVELPSEKIHAEIRSLNSKAMDLSTRLAPVFREKEMEIRTLVSQTLERGKADLTLWIDKDEASAATPIHTELAKGYYCELSALAEELRIDPPQDWLMLLTRMPDVLAKADTAELTDEEWQAARRALEEALAQHAAFRRQEGAALELKFREKIQNITQLLASIAPYEAERVEKIRARIVEGLEKLGAADYDRNRLEQEMIYYIEKLDINEEKQRLANHLKYFVETLETGHGQGKKLGFIAQEMGREINMLGSKSNQAEMQNIVVRMKDELEQIKEQVLNVL